jgi:hypothetical protein
VGEGTLNMSCVLGDEIVTTADGVSWSDPPPRFKLPAGITPFLGAPQGGPVTKTAAQIVQQAADEIAQRGQLRDKSSGERSMKRTVDAFNGLLGRPALTEQEGWLFMCVLKMARATAGKHHLDDYTDLAGYAGLAGECGELAKAANEEVWQFNEGKVSNG